MVKKKEITKNIKKPKKKKHNSQKQSLAAALNSAGISKTKKRGKK